MNPDQANELYFKGVVARQQGKLDQAAAFFVQAAHSNLSDSDFLLKIGQILEHLQKPALAANIYQNVLKNNLNNVEAYLGFGRSLMKMADNKMAVQCFEQAAKLQPEDKEIYSYLAQAYWADNEGEKGVDALKEAYRLGKPPDYYYVNLANHFERNNMLEEVGEVLKEGLEIRPDHPTLLVLSGAYYFRTGDLEKALEVLLKVEGKSEFNSVNLRLYFELGRIYDKLGQHQKAYESYTLANDYSKAEVQLRSGNVVKNRKFIKNVEGMNFAGWDDVTADPLQGAENNPIFLVGFPRSGTTLLTRILDSHMKIECVDEEPILIGTKKILINKYGGYFRALKNLTTKQLNELRDDYVKRSKKYRKTGEGIYLVDKYPLMLVEIPFIRKIFPKSKIILASRHPCDCTLSCFMQNFDLNPAMLNFLNMDDATSYYVEVMKHWLLFCKEMPFDYYQFKYENLIQDQETEIKKLVAYLELDWDPGIMKFTSKAAEVGRIKTPSYSQVVKPIYKEARGRWRNYEQEMTPYLNRLKPYCEFFGYTL